MTTQEALEAVFQKIVENARAICVACNLERKGRSPLPVWAIHTCDATIDAAAKGMLAAVDGALAILFATYHPVDEEAQRKPDWYWLTPKVADRWAYVSIEATINRLREEAKK